MRRPTRCIAAFLLTTYVSACTSWKVQTVAPEQTFSDSSYVSKGARVTTLDSQQVEIKHPTLTGETITGRSRRGATIIIPLQNITRLEVKRPDTGKTIMLIVGSAAGAGALTLAAICIAFCGHYD